MNPQQFLHSPALQPRAAALLMGIVSMSLTLVGCATLPVLFVGPRLDDVLKPRPVLIDDAERPLPLPPLAEGDGRRDSPSGRVRAAIDSEEEERFSGAYTMETLERIAIRHNPTLRQAVAEVEGEEGKAVQAGLYPNPKLGFSASNIGLPGGPMNEFGFVQQTFVSGGKLRLSREKFLARATAAEFEVLSTIYRVVNGVDIEFLRTLGQQRRVAIQKERLKTAQDALVTTQEMFNVGQANRADLHRAQVALQKQELTVLMAENDLRMHWERLATVVGVPLPPGQLVGDLEVELPLLNFDKEYERILARNPHLGRTEALLKSEYITVERELVEPIPNLTVLAGGGRSLFLNVYTGDVIAKLDVPVFDWNQGTILQARADLRRQQNEIVRVELQLRRTLADFFKKYLSAQQHVRAFKTVILPQLQERYTTQLKSYHEDRQVWLKFPPLVPELPILPPSQPLEGVLLAQEDFFLHRLQYIDHLVDWRTAYIAIRGLLMVDGLDVPPTVTAPGHIMAVPKPR